MILMQYISLIIQQRDGDPLFLGPRKLIDLCLNMKYYLVLIRCWASKWANANVMKECKHDKYN